MMTNVRTLSSTSFVINSINMARKKTGRLWLLILHVSYYTWRDFGRDLVLVWIYIFLQCSIYCVSVELGGYRNLLETHVEALHMIMTERKFRRNYFSIRAQADSTLYYLLVLSKKNACKAFRLQYLFHKITLFQVL